MRDLRILLVQTRYTLVAMLRTPRAILFGLVFPVVLLMLFGEIFAKGSNTYTQLDDLRIKTVAYYTAGLTAYAIMMQTFASLAITVVTQRESGQLKRLRGTPMRSWTFIGAYVMRSVVSVAFALVVLYAVGVLVLDVHVHAAGVLGLVIYAALGTLALGALGLVLTIVCPSADAASAVGPFAAVILAFISGVFIQLKELPGWLQSVSKVFPLEHLASGLQHGLVQHATGTGLRPLDLAVLAAWAVGCLVVAAGGFRWEPQTAPA